MGQSEEVLALGDSQLECLRKSSHCLGRELHILALLEPCVPAHADPSQLRQLLTPQSKGSAAVDALGESDVLGPQRRTSGTKERPQLLALLLGWHGVLLDRGRKRSLTVFVLGERGSRTQHCCALTSRLAWGGSRGGCCTRLSKRRRLRLELSPLRIPAPTSPNSASRPPDLTQGLQRRLRQDPERDLVGGICARGTTGHASGRSDRNVREGNPPRRQTWRDGCGRQSRRRRERSSGTSTRQMRTPSGSAIHISSSP